MDLDEDGETDILSGSYSRQDLDMAGLFQVLWGTGPGKFKKPEPLKGSNGKLLIIKASKKDVVDKICTRPTAVDLDGDGKLDIVSGNFTGTFAFFKGRGGGKFSPKTEWLMRRGRRLAVPAHSDPFFVDWDGDGDLDLLSGSGRGGVFLCTNVGTKKQPKFTQPSTLVAAAGHGNPGEVVFGEGHITGPQSGTRVFADDLDGDGKLDLLVGDNATVEFPANGLDEKTAREKLAAWNEKQQELSNAMANASKSKRKELDKAWREHWKARDRLVRTERTGFVWVFYGK